MELDIFGDRDTYRETGRHKDTQSDPHHDIERENEPEGIEGDSSVTCVTFSQLFSSLKLCR